MLNISTLFDEQFYLNANPDVINAVATGIFSTAFDHFVTRGQFEGRNPSAFFDTSFSRRKNPDVAAAVKDEITGLCYCL
ncbi:hypothetical protein NG798_23870 [Ancylothrix sp. C2]|uniref:hypothetical protein n=1 Tax=Ancylothrix sp. D3o TaxID=2953691 RepID=UPI0021BAA42F|nr:hypothetical protein [Ancylothrix sp. D3o]MCT7952843.1 hypothetical protein [Ancylothrix sp. D3o]